MSDERRFDLYDPKYGRVRELCKDLGYASDRKRTPRSMHYLTTKTTAFRKKFIESTPEIIHFPLEYESAEAQECAARFLTSHVNLFENSAEAQAFSWPIYPADTLRSVYLDHIFRTRLI
jgi:hypothetical protein